MIKLYFYTIFISEKQIHANSDALAGLKSCHNNRKRKSISRFEVVMLMQTLKIHEIFTFSLRKNSVA